MKKAHELKEQITRIKVEAFDLVRTNRSINPKFTGHKSEEHRALLTINEAAEKIEKLIQQWERNNK